MKSCLFFLSILLIKYLTTTTFSETIEDTFRQQKEIGAANVCIQAKIPIALDLYEIDNGSYSTTQEGLQALLIKPNSAVNWKGPYLKSKKDLIDPWGNLYVYFYPSKTKGEGYFDLYSLGPDGLDGTQDDVTLQRTKGEMLEAGDLAEMLAGIENIIRRDAFYPDDLKPISDGGLRLSLATSEINNVFKFTDELRKSLLFTQIKIINVIKNDKGVKFTIDLYFSDKASDKQIRTEELTLLKEKFLKIDFEKSKEIAE